MAGARRHIANDPDRKARITAAALEVVIDLGVHRTTHRRIAERAGVPLGSVTYYFDGLPELYGAAFRLLAGSMSEQYRQALRAAGTRAEACAAVTELICGSAYSTPRQMTALFELYAYSSHHADARAVTRQWLTTSRDTLARHFAEPTCRALDALVEGWLLHQHVEGVPLDRALVSTTVRAVVERLEADGRPGSPPTMEPAERGTRA